jgi:glycosyltransferase involved in cell wall biosynthesis
MENTGHIHSQMKNSSKLCMNEPFTKSSEKQIVTNSNYSVSAIVCAFNEEETLSGVVRALIAAKEVNEIIVINDGSTDGTSAALKKFANQPKVEVIEFLHNRGKGFAMAEGIMKAKGEILLFVDADLLNFQKHYVPLLLCPLWDGKADMVIGHPTENVLDKKINPFKSIAGERAVFKKDILPITEKTRNSGYGVETIINLFYTAQNKRIEYVYLWGLLHPIKLHKHSAKTAMRKYLQEAYQISRSVIKNYLWLLIIARNIIGRLI